VPLYRDTLFVVLLLLIRPVYIGPNTIFVFLDDKILLSYFELLNYSRSKSYFM
jgi:hypothetical protein